MRVFDRQCENIALGRDQRPYRLLNLGQAFVLSLIVSPFASDCSHVHRIGWVQRHAASVARNASPGTLVTTVSPSCFNKTNFTAPASAFLSTFISSI